MADSFVRNGAYGLNFVLRPEACVKEAEERHIYLVEDEKRSFVRDEKRHRNILIEGENYKALKILSYTHAGKVDCIYIDPPYNTGNKDFVYNDDFSEELPEEDEGDENPHYVDRDDQCRHSKWLSFMKRRLELAKGLLSERGVIFISIDDNEFAQLKLLCDGVFGEENFLANMVWKKKATNGGMAKGGFSINIQTEYVLFYAKSKEHAVINGVPGGETLDAKYKFEDDKGKYRLVDLAGYGLTYQQSLDYEIESPEGKVIRANDVMGVKYNAGWRWSKKKYEDNKGQIVWVKGKPKTKTYMNGDCQYVHPSNLLDDKALLSNVDTAVEDALGEKLFDYAKPVELIKRLLFVGSQKDSLVLDFFAGSATTGQAVAELNKEDGGTRQFILITNNDKSDKLPQGICRQVSYPRLSKTIGNENLTTFRVKTLKKASKSRLTNVDQLINGNKLLPILKLQHGTFKTHEATEQYTILANHAEDFFLGVWEGDVGGIGHHTNAFQAKLNSLGNNLLLSNEYTSKDEEASYPSDYYDFISK